MPSSEVENLDENNTTVEARIANRGEARGFQEVNEGKCENNSCEANGFQGNANSLPMEIEEEEEEDDADFIPLLKESPSQEASSSLSSEVDGFDADTLDNATSLPSLNSNGKPPVPDFLDRETDYGEEATVHVPLSPVDSYINVPSGSLLENSHVSSTNNCLANGEPKNATNFQDPSLKSDDEDAICMRTRARYSLASFSLDELETFLQESDDEDDLQNADEEEYRKFLAAVLLGGDADPQNLPDNEHVDDEDEENDADFELEIQEALESDVDEDTREEIQQKELGSRRPKTRQNRNKKTYVKGNKKPLSQSKRPLRPILPNMSITQMAPFSAIHGKSFVLNHAPDFTPPVIEGSRNGFTPNQLRQLHCLVYEHVQLLIQIFSLSVLEPCRRNVALKVEELILELLSIRGRVLTQRRFPYPNFCVFTPHVHLSVPDESSTVLPAHGVSPCSVDLPRSFPSVNMPLSDAVYTSGGRHGCVQNGQHQASSWIPYIDGPVLSVLDVAPLRLAEKYMVDVATVVKDYHRCQLHVPCDAPVEREPLFQQHSFQVSAESYDQLTRKCPASSMPLSSSESDQVPKRSMASTLVEKAKKQSVAPVPKEIAKLAQTFYPLFNPALYPHKPPLARIANRVLFTDAEDELLALGLMEYNNDWEAIQRRFLPCKSKHQIFVRQKNRSSSNATENSIKAVRRMKNSPLTPEEIARIKEGLKIFKLDWMSIWKFLVPHRDPSMLPRQWRIANGIQKEYKADETTKAKRRLYQQIKNSKPAAVACTHSSSEKEDGGAETAREADNNRNNEVSKDVAYVHEAFLADWRPHNTSGTTDCHAIAPGEIDLPAESLLVEGSEVGIPLNIRGSMSSQPSTSNVPASVARPYRARRSNRARMVKLAPDLPPVNLPPSVRVMSESTFKSYQGQIQKIPVSKGSSFQQPQHSVFVNNKHAVDENEKELQMHPLLFQPPGNGHFPHYLSPIASSSIDFVSRSPQLNLNLRHNQHSSSSTHPFSFLGRSSEPMQSTSSFSGIHFHPLLQKADNLNHSMVNGQPNSHFFSISDSSERSCALESNNSGLQPTVSHVNISSPTTSARPVSPKEKNNELDLDIHLSFPSRRQKPSLGCTVVNEVSMTRAVDPSDSLGLGSKSPKNSFYQPGHDRSTSCASDTGKFDSGVYQPVVACEENLHGVDSSEAHSFPEVIMEQEELSDSEDEIGEDVDFECEEMMDSDTEGSDYEQIAGILNEGSGTVAENALDKQQFEPENGSGSRCSVVGSPNARKVDDSSSSLGLNLNSFPPASPFVENEVAKDCDTLTRNISPCSTGTNEGKMLNSNMTRLLEKDVDLKQDSGSISLGRSRKRACSEPRLSRGRSKRTSSRKANTNSASSTPVGSDQAV